MACSEFTSLIDSYLKEDIPEEKREAFEAHFFECDACFHELKLRERLYSKEVPIVLKGTKPFWAWRFKPILALASLLVVVVSSFLVIDNYNRAKFLFEISGVDPPAYVQSETRNTFQDQALSKAMTMYNNRQYGQALELLETAGKDTSPEAWNPQIVFFKGICRLQLNQPKAAIRHFDEIIEEMNPSYYDEAIFYKGIALLRLNKKGAALEQLKNVAAMFSPHAPRAKEIIKKINN